MTRFPTIVNDSDIESNFPDYLFMDGDERDKRREARERGKQVRVIGKYTQIDARQRPSPPPVYEGIVAIILADSTAVYLYPMWHPSAIRPAEEIAQYDNKQVVVVGKMVPRTPKSPEPRAMIVGPCMLTIDSIDFWTQE